MHNWLNQELHVGDLVYRGARNGNSSSFKIGKIVKITPSGIRVNWVLEPGAVWTGGGMFKVPRTINSYGSPDADSLVKIDHMQIEFAKLLKIADEIDSIVRDARTKKIQVPAFKIQDLFKHYDYGG